ncbi:MAG: dTMP kinase [Verrucomicrobiota bacterium]
MFISFEGSEGCGKTTQIEQLESRLRSEGIQVTRTREPGGTPLGEALRHLLKFAPEGEGMTSASELFLFAGSRAQLVHEVIQPAIASGGVVLADRFIDSTTVYQGAGRGLPQDAIEVVNGLAIGETVPHVTFLLDMDSEIAWTRAVEQTMNLFPNDGYADRMEQEEKTFYEKVRQGYLQIAADQPARFRVINADRPVEDISEDIWNEVKGWIDGLSS